MGGVSGVSGMDGVDGRTTEQPYVAGETRQVTSDGNTVEQPDKEELAIH